MVTRLQTFEGGPPLSEDDLTSFEKKHGLSLPTAYKAFLLATNGGRPERDLFKINGLEGNSLGRIHLFYALRDPVESCNLDWNLEVFRDRIPADLLPIATTEGADKVCVLIAGERAGAIFYWDGHAPAGEYNLYALADDFASFIASLHADALSPRSPES
jgi:SMI1 / KNR4 family (SUKH-1)